MAFFPSQGLPPGQGARDQGNALIEFAMGADDGRFSNDHAGAVIDEEMGPDLCARMDINAGAGVGPLGHHPREDGNTLIVKLMCHSLDGECFHERVGDDDFIRA